jgi:uncharacterized protein (DUF433 family)
MADIPTIAEHIEITLEVCGGKPRIAGHRIRVQDIAVWHELMNLSPDEIVYHHPSITLADVYAALAYYHDHREVIRQDIRAGEALVRAVQAERLLCFSKSSGHSNDYRGNKSGIDWVERSGTQPKVTTQ